MSSGEVPLAKSPYLTIACPNTGDTVPSGDIYVSGLSSGVTSGKNIDVKLWYNGEEFASNTAEVKSDFWSCTLAGTIIGSGFEIKATFGGADPDEVTNITIAPSAPIGRGSGGGISGFAASGPNSEVKIEYRAKNNSEPLLFFLVPEEHTSDGWAFIDNKHSVERKNSHTGSGSARRPYRAQFATNGKLAEDNRVVVYMRDSSGKLTQYTVTRAS